MTEGAYEVALPDPSGAELLGASTTAKLEDQIVVLRDGLDLAVSLRVRISSAYGSQAWNGCDFLFARLWGTTQEGSESLAQNAFMVTTTTIFYEQVSCELRGIIRGNREPLFVPGGSNVYILVPWKPVVLVWGLLSGMILISFVASSVLQGKDPFAPGATSTQPSSVKTGVAQTEQFKHSHKAAPTPSH
jgi:hypothetical protein